MFLKYLKASPMKPGQLRCNTASFMKILIISESIRIQSSVHIRFSLCVWFFIPIDSEARKAARKAAALEEDAAAAEAEDKKASILPLSCKI